MITYFLAILNMIGCGVGLARYAWVTQTPESLAIGVFCGFVALFTAITKK